MISGDGGDMTTKKIQNAVEQARYALQLLPETAISPEVFLKLLDEFLHARSESETKGNSQDDLTSDVREHVPCEEIK